MSKLSIVDLQRYDCARRGDVDGYKKLMEFNRSYYSSVPVVEENGQLIAMLPTDVFRVKKRNLIDEFSRANRRTYIDWVKINEEGYLEIKGHVYIQRLNMGEAYEQDITAVLVNEETNQIIEIPTESIKTCFLTEHFGNVYDKPSNKTINYNYDNTGFRFTIGTEIIDKIRLRRLLKFSLFVKYKDRYFEGTQRIIGVNADNREMFESLGKVFGDKRVNVKFGELDEFFVVVKKIKQKN